MAFKAALVLLSIVVAVSATNIGPIENSPFVQKINGDINQVCNEFLGAPCKYSPPPPPPGTPVTPPAPVIPPPIPAPTPGQPIGQGESAAVVTYSLPGGAQLTPAQLARITALFQEAIGNNGDVTVTNTPNGRKLLAIESMNVGTDNVVSCPRLTTDINTFVQGKQLERQANLAGIPISNTNLLSISCIGAGTSVVTNPPLPEAPTPARR